MRCAGTADDRHPVANPTRVSSHFDRSRTKWGKDGFRAIRTNGRGHHVLRISRSPRGQTSTSSGTATTATVRAERRMRHNRHAVFAVHETVYRHITDANAPAWMARVSRAVDGPHVVEDDGHR